MGKPFKYLTSCVACGDGDAINEMKAASKSITLKTMRKHCDMEGLEQELGYCTRTKYDDSGLWLGRDWHVSFDKSRYKGEPCYYLTHSGIEYIFIAQEVAKGIKLHYGRG